MREWTLPARTDSVPLARRLAVESLPGVSGVASETVALVVSELVTNCVRHAGTEFRLRVISNPNQIQVEVTDTAGGQPRVKQPAPTDPHGRGLQIVETLARRWGVVPAGDGTGKTVWCTVALTS